MVTSDFQKLMQRIEVEGGTKYYIDVSSRAALNSSLENHFGNTLMGYASVYKDEHGYYIGGHSPGRIKPATNVVDILTKFIMSENS